MKKTFQIIKDALLSALFMSSIMAVICLLFCNKDPLKVNVYRVLAVFFTTLGFLALPFIWILFVGILTFPLRLFDNKKKRD